MKNKIILLVVVMLVVSSYNVLAWDPNPVYNPFETIWNAINNINSRETLDSLDCANDQVPLWNGASWECSDYPIPKDSLLLKLQEYGMFSDDLSLLDCPTKSNPVLTIRSGSDNLGKVLGLAGKEAVSELYEYYVLIDTTSNVHQYLGSSVNITVKHPARDYYFSGIIYEIESLGANNHILRIGPDIEILALRHGFSAYESYKLSGIVQQVLGDIGLSGSIASTYITHDHILQYDESLLNFIDRHARKEGFFWYFVHENGGTKFHFIDDNSGFANPHSIIIHSSTLELNKKSKIVYDKVSLTSYDYIGPSSPLGEYGKGSNEYISFTPGISSSGELDQFSRMRLEAFQTEAENYNGIGSSPALRAGYGFTLKSAEYYTISAIHGLILKNSCYYYGNKVKAINASKPYRPDYIEHTPKAASIETARVVDNVDPDGLGRVKVQFNWRELGTHNQLSSAWIRVGTPFAGSKTGPNKDTFYPLPEVDTDVIIAYEWGDPDRPIIIGTLHNGVNTPYDQRDISISGDLTLLGELILPSTANIRVGSYDLSLNSKASTLTINASNDLKIVTGQDLSIHTERDMNTKVGRDADISVTGDKKEDIYGSDTSKVTGTKSDEGVGMVKIKAGSTLDIDAVMVDIDGTIVDIDGSPITLN